MKNLIKKLRPVWSSNFSILAFSLNASLFIKDAVEYTKNITRYLHFILLGLVVAIVLLIFRFLFEDKDASDINNMDVEQKIKDTKNGADNIGNSTINAENDSDQVELERENSPLLSEIINDSRREFCHKSEDQNTIGKTEKSESSENSVINLRKGDSKNGLIIHPLWKITFGLVISTVLFVLISGIILYKSDVYYVVLRNNIQSEYEANELVRMSNEALRAKGIEDYKASRLYKGKKANQYLVTINGGFLVEDDAERVKDMLISNGFNNTVTPVVNRSSADFKRKLVYLNQLFSNE
jgi:cell division protein FtsL